MSRFVDRSATRTVPLGPCECPDSPHSQDEAAIRSELSGQEIADFINSPDGPETARVIAPWITSWNLQDANGKAVEPSFEALLDLDHTTLTPLVAGINEVVVASAKRGASPKAPSEPSRNGTRASASRTPKTKTPA